MSETVHFTVPGEPVGKGRPRFVRETGRTYTPQKTANFETLVKWEYHRQCSGKRFPDDAALRMRVVAKFAIPKSKTKRMRQAMESGEVRHTKKPDADNVLKAVADALNHIAYSDDSAIAEALILKRYSSTPETDITIEQI